MRTKCTLSGLPFDESLVVHCTLKLSLNIYHFLTNNYTFVHNFNTFKIDFITR